MTTLSKNLTQHLLLLWILELYLPLTQQCNCFKTFRLLFRLQLCFLLIRRDWKTNIVLDAVFSQINSHLITFLSTRLFSIANKSKAPRLVSFWVNDGWIYLSLGGWIGICQDPTVTAKLHWLPINNICPSPPTTRHNSTLISQQTTTNWNYTKTTTFHIICALLWKSVTGILSKRHPITAF